MDCPDERHSPPAKKLEFVAGYDEAITRQKRQRLPARESNGANCATPEFWKAKPLVPASENSPRSKLKLPAYAASWR